MAICGSLGRQDRGLSYGDAFQTLSEPRFAAQSAMAKLDSKATGWEPLVTWPLGPYHMELMKPIYSTESYI